MAVTFAQFTVIDEYMCHPKQARLTWEEAACFMLTGATAYRQLTGWPPHTVKPNDPVLIWGRLPDPKDPQAYGEWLKGVRAFGKKFWELLGDKRSPRIVVEHPGESTMPTSI